MSSDYDASEFVDGDFQSHKMAASGASAEPGQEPGQRAPTREEVDTKVADAQQRLAELKRAQEELERERAGLEETRRRQLEFQTGRQEMVHNLTRGLGLLEESEFNARRDAAQMAKAVVDLREALTKIEAIHEETWTSGNFGVELTRALTTLENARMEWNSARLELPVLTGGSRENPAGGPNSSQPEAAALIQNRSLGELCRLGLALTWPLAAVGLLAVGLLLAVLFRK